MKWNFCAYIIGPPEYGKTTLLRQLVERHFKSMPTGIVFVHDPVAQFAGDGCAYYKDANAWRAAAADVAKNKGATMPRGASVGGSAEDLTRLALSLGEKCGNTHEHVRVPILLAFDEASLRDGSGATWMGKDDNELLATRRHRGVGIVFNLQDASQLTERFFRMSTDVYVFVQTTENTWKLEKALMLERGRLAPHVASLEKHDYLHVRLVEGIVQEAL